MGALRRNFWDCFTPKEKSWIMYDWANSVHSIVVVTILPIFYMALMQDNTTATSWWGYGTSAAKLVVAILAPILGALGDFKGYKKRLFTFFVILGTAACLGLAPMPYFPNWQTILILYVISTIGFAGANIYYDSFLPEITTHERMDRVSTMGFGYGYIGGSTIPFIIFLILYGAGSRIGIDSNASIAIAFAMTGIWWALFTIPLWKNVHQTHWVERTRGVVADSFRRLLETLRNIRNYKSMFVFILAYFFYIDGVNTIIYMSTVYGTSLGIDSTQMMLALLMVQILGFPFAILYTHLARRFGARTMIGVGILIYMGICLMAFNVTKAWHFWALAFAVSTSQGGIQALSRSMFGKMIPDKNRCSEFFGFFEIFGKFSAIMGPALFGAVAAFAGNIIKARQNIPDDAAREVLDQVSRQATPWGVLSVLAIFIIGAALFFFALPRALKKEQEEKAG